MEDSVHVQLDPGNNIHILALQTVYSPFSEDELVKFQRGWNANPSRIANQKPP